MRNIRSALVICVCCVLSTLAQDRPERDQMELKGPVKSVDYKIVDHVRTDGDPSKGKSRPKYRVTFDRRGYATSRITYSHDKPGEVIEKCTYTFDEQGRKTGYEEYAAVLDKTFTIPRRHVFTLNKKGQRIEYKVLEMDGTAGIRFTYVYDKAGRKSAEETFYHTGRSGGIVIYKYDNKGNETSRRLQLPDGTVSWKKEFRLRYDDSDRIVEWQHYFEGVHKYTMSYKYDNLGNLIEETTREFNRAPNALPFSHAPKTGTKSYTFNPDRKLLTKTQMDLDGSAITKTVYKYDAMGSQTEATGYKSDGSANEQSISFYDDISDPKSKFHGSFSGTSSIQYTYDERGNWIQKIYFLRSKTDTDPRAYRAEERVIEYY